MTIYFESYSILQTLILFRRIRKAGTIYFHGDHPLSKFHSVKGKKKKIVIRLLKLINKNINILTVSQAKMNHYIWKSNRESLQIIDDIGKSIKSNFLYKMILSVLNDNNIVKYYQHFLAKNGVVSNRIAFMKIARDLSHSEDSIIIVPYENDYFGLAEIFLKKTLNADMPYLIFQTNRLRHLAKKIKEGFIFIFLPGFYIASKVIKDGFMFRRIEKRKYDVLLRIIWGFNDNMLKIGARFHKNDGFLYNPSLGLNSIFYIFDRKHYDPGIKEESKKIMKKRGIPFMDRQDFRVNANVVVRAIKLQVIILLNLFRLVYHLINSHYVFNRIGWRIIYDILNKWIETEFLDYKVDFCRNDQNSDSIIETIISNKYSARTVGIQHIAASGPYVFPQLCYVHFNKYCIHSSAHLRLFSPYWEALNLARTGHIAIDDILSIYNDKTLLNNLRKKIISLYGDRKYIVLIVFPNAGRPLNLAEKWDEMYSALCELRHYDIDANVFLRFRDIKQLNNPQAGRFAGLPKQDDRIIIDHDNFKTYEIMAVCDLYITYSHSSGMIEAVSIGKKSFTFDFMDTTKYCFSRYGEDIILRKKEDVLKVFQGLKNNFTSFDCNWDLLRKEYNYYYDGKCLERLQKVIKETIQEVNVNNPVR